MLFALCIPAQAQQAKKVPRIGILFGGSSSRYSVRVEAFRQRLKELGYIEGKNIAIEYQYADGKADRLLSLATELVLLKVDVIVATSTPSVLATQKATSTIPIVFTGVGDPVAGGLVASLARPGGNITGLTILAPELSGKRVELLKEAVPNATRVAFLWNPTNPSHGLLLKETMQRHKH